MKLIISVNSLYILLPYRYYLKGEKAGQTDVFVAGLAGYPDNIRSNGKGGFYVAIPVLRPQDVINKS